MENILKNSQRPMNDTAADDRLRVGALSLDIKWASPRENVEQVSLCLEKHGSDIDVLVLPELFSTGYSQDIDVLKELAEGDDGPTISMLKQFSKEHDVAIAGSYLARIEDGYANRGFIVLPSGEAVYYNKRHLFGLSAEAKLFTAGKELPPIVMYKGWRIALIVCYDLRFPVWTRCYKGEREYDMLLVVANWPQSRQYAWEHLLIARAIENQAIVVGCDRSGSDVFGVYDELTRVYDSTGHEPESEVRELLKIVNLSLNELSDYRRRWPIARDADSFTLLH